MPAENRSLQPLLGQKSISLKSRTEGVICLCRLQQWVINWQRSKHCTRMPIKALYQLWEPWTMREYFTDIHSDFKKCYLNTERSSINSTFNASVEGIPTYSAAETAERISMDQPKAALWEVIQANNISFQHFLGTAVPGLQEELKSPSERWCNCIWQLPSSHAMQGRHRT